MKNCFKDWSQSNSSLKSYEINPRKVKKERQNLWYVLTVIMTVAGRIYNENSFYMKGHNINMLGNWQASIYEDCLVSMDLSDITVLIKLTNDVTSK